MEVEVVEVEVMVVIKMQSQGKDPSWCYGGCRHRSVMGAWVGGWWMVGWSDRDFGEEPIPASS